MIKVCEYYLINVVSAPVNFSLNSLFKSFTKLDNGGNPVLPWTLVDGGLVAFDID